MHIANVSFMCKVALSLRHPRYVKANQITYGSCFGDLHSNETVQRALVVSGATAARGKRASGEEKVAHTRGRRSVCRN